MILRRMNKTGFGSSHPGAFSDLVDQITRQIKQVIMQVTVHLTEKQEMLLVLEKNHFVICGLYNENLIFLPQDHLPLSGVCISKYQVKFILQTVQP